MAKYRKKQSEIMEAVIWDGNNNDEIMQFCEDAAIFNTNGSLTVDTPAGYITADIGDIISKDKRGIWFSDPEYFADNYELVEELTA